MQFGSTVQLSDGLSWISLIAFDEGERSLNRLNVEIFALCMIINLAPPKSYFQGRMTSSPRHVHLPSPYFWTDFDSLDKISNLRTVST